MAYDEKLAERLRDLLAGENHVTEKKMFGGLAFLVDGRLAVAASRRGGILARVDPDHTEKLLAGEYVESMEMGGRPQAGWLHVAPEALRTKLQLAAWVKRCVAYAKTLPAR
jgi:TfoX/Sxy family transcriptional regulator of competence genes